MSKMKSIVNAISSKLSISRRSFIKATLAVGGSSTIIGCYKGSGEPIFVGSGSGLDNVISPEDLSNAKIYHAGCVHNCGAGSRCVSKLHVVKGRVVRVTSDDSDRDYEGNLRDKEQYNDSRALSCAKGRAFKYKLYHPGRLKYTLKQTKARGDMTGFVRVPSEVAMKEVATKYRSTYEKYGSTAIYNTYGTATSYGGTFSSALHARNALTTFVGGTRAAYSNYSYHQFDFANVLTGHPAISGYGTIGRQLGSVAGVVKNIVSWGSNVLTSNNTVAWPYIRAIEMMKQERDGKVYFIGPEFVDTGVTCATDWVQLRNYTDSALIMAMFHEMIINTVDENGNIISNTWLDLEYLDTMVYGFFDSPAYWVKKTDGVITLTDPNNSNDYIKVDEIPAGKSLSAYVMGSDDRLTKLQYNVSKNYTAKQFGNISRNVSTCSYPSDTESKYYYKQDMNTPKTPEWASVICGTPEQTIKDLARMYTDPAQHPILNEWCGGVQKQDNGVVNLFSIASLLCVTKTFGLNGEGLFGPWASSIDNPGDKGPSTDYISSLGSSSSVVPKYEELKTVASPSVKEWFNCMKLAYHDTLKTNGYTGKHLPEWDGVTRYINDDGGAKASIQFEYESNLMAVSYPKLFNDNGIAYYKYIGQESDTPTSGTPIYTGTRMIVNAGGGIQGNQHMNTNDTTEMYRKLPITSQDPTNADSFCLVTFDIYMSPTARYADYVFASTVSLETGDWMIIGGEVNYRPGVSKAPGEVKDGWRYAYEAYRAQAGLGNPSWATITDIDKAHFKYVGTDGKSNAYQSSDVLSLKIVDKAIASADSRFYGMTREEVFEKQYRPRKNQDPKITTDQRVGAKGELLREKLDTYLALGNRMSAKPFVYNNNDYPNTVIPGKPIPNDPDGGRYPDTIIPGNYASATVQGWGSGAGNIAEWGDGTRPNFTGKFHVYNGAMVWDYERRFSKWHGWLPKEQRGQKNKDYEGDPIVYPIPMYFDFRDSFNEAYGVFPIKDASGTIVKQGKPENDLSKNHGLTLSTTHDRYRVHSTNAENPLLRELNHRTKGGGYGSGNDWKEYAVMPDRHIEGATAPISPMISSAVYKKDMKTASWHEIWINDQDAADREIEENDLIVVENPIGAVRVIARLTKRCMRGHINLHQGGWYDPNPIDGIDDGGCANTLMSSKPSRIDNGNAQQSAYVTVRKDTLFV